VSSIKPHKGLLSGFITSILNPKACLFFLSFFSVMLSPATELRTQIFYGVWISLLALIWFVLVAFFFTTPMIGQKLQNSKHWIERITGGVLMLLSLKLLSSKASI
jgi:threonine/homoserine/homoserine lactone efflux protein